MSALFPFRATADDLLPLDRFQSLGSPSSAVAGSDAPQASTTSPGLFEQFQGVLKGITGGFREFLNARNELERLKLQSRLEEIRTEAALNAAARDAQQAPPSLLFFPSGSSSSGAGVGALPPASGPTIVQGGGSAPAAGGFLGGQGALIVLAVLAALLMGSR